METAVTRDQLSPDGKYIWDGQQWSPVVHVPARQPSHGGRNAAIIVGAVVTIIAVASALSNSKDGSPNAGMTDTTAKAAAAADAAPTTPPAHLPSQSELGEAWKAAIAPQMALPPEGQRNRDRLLGRPC
jgi:hypothetical protein